MEESGQGCFAMLEPRYWRAHELMVRLLGRCTCTDAARVAELFEIDSGPDEPDLEPDRLLAV